MKKSELRQLIREVLKEELSTRSSIQEGAYSGGYAGDNSFSGGTVRGIGASTQPDKKNYLGRLKSKNPDLVNTMTVKGKDVKPGMITQAGEVKTAEVKYSNHYGKDMVYIMHTNDWDGFYEVDGDMEVMADPDDKSKPYSGGYLELKKKGLQESVEEVVEDDLDEGIFGNKYKGKSILVYRGNGKDEAIAIAGGEGIKGIQNLSCFKDAHANKYGNKESDYATTAATDMAVKKYKKSLKNAVDVSSNLPGWVEDYLDEKKEQRGRELENERREQERERQAKRKADSDYYKKLGAAKNPDDDYVYVKGNGSGTYKYRESLEESLTEDNIFEGLF